jgi:hypothetical protein
MRLIDAEGSELQTQLKIIREAEYQIYGSGSWGFTAKCEHAIEDAPTIQPEPQIIRCKDCGHRDDHGCCKMCGYVKPVKEWKGARI